MAKKVLVRTAVGLILIVPVAGLAVAQVQQPVATPKGAVVRDSVVQQAPVATVGPVSPPSRPGVLGVQDLMVLLTVDECKNLGGVVDDSKTCASGQRCMTAGEDGVIRSKCISKAN